MKQTVSKKLAKEDEVKRKTRKRRLTVRDDGRLHTPVHGNSQDPPASTEVPQYDAQAQYLVLKEDGLQRPLDLPTYKDQSPPKVLKPVEVEPKLEDYEVLKRRNYYNMHTSQYESVENYTTVAGTPTSVESRDKVYQEGHSTIVPGLGVGARPKDPAVVSSKRKQTQTNKRNVPPKSHYSASLPIHPGTDVVQYHHDQAPGDESDSVMSNVYDDIPLNVGGEDAGGNAVIRMLSHGTALNTQPAMPRESTITDAYESIPESTH